ncbi:MAG: glycosyltransferase family 2 protein [Bacteroidales bacterium]|jgi:glycosyltransferase involved in cell wall biosynthesis|nr:glycosyltransferase family 2 protein [Bacteroidales bacterium]
MYISAVIITKNEERNIERCLVSLQDIVDEIIVVDSFSTDKTKNICEQYNVRFFQQEWQGYAQQKNYANSLATYDMILSIDADEALSLELQQALVELKLNENQNFVGQLNRLTNYCGQWIYHCGWYPDKKIRLFNRNHAKWEGLIHETLSYPKETSVIALKGNLFHYSYYTVEDHIKQINIFTTFTATQAFEKRERYLLFFVMIISCWKFLRDYIFKSGFRDGYYGYIICRISAFGVFLKYVKLKQLRKQQQKKKS